MIPEKIWAFYLEHLKLFRMHIELTYGSTHPFVVLPNPNYVWDLEQYALWRRRMTACWQMFFENAKCDWSPDWAVDLADRYMAWNGSNDD